jgi:hypothetical protein
MNDGCQMTRVRRHWRRLRKVVRQAAWVSPGSVFFTDFATLRVTYV